MLSEDPTYVPKTDLEISREFFRKGMRSLTDGEVESLAVEIVNQIRIRRQSGLGAGEGPFVVQDFIDSGVIELAKEYDYKRFDRFSI